MKGHVLAVDDDIVLLKTIEMILKEDYTVDLASSGEMAMEILRKGRLPDAILLDVDMPGLDGYQMMEKIKETDAYRYIPIIYLTALTDTDHEVRGIRLGAADYIRKPFEKENLLARLEGRIETGKRLRWKAGLDPEVEKKLRKILTPKELTVAGLVAEGKSNKEIAEELFHTERYIGNIISVIHQKVGTTARAELRRYLRGE